MNLKTNDTVKIISGADRGRTGQIIKIFPRRRRVLIEGVNTYKKHLKPQGQQKGGVVTLSRPLPASKVQLVCPHCSRPTRTRLSGTGRDKVRLCLKCSKPITIAPAPKGSKKTK